MRLPRRRREARDGVDVDVRRDLVAQVDLVGGLRAQTVEDERDL